MTNNLTAVKKFLHSNEKKMIHETRFDAVNIQTYNFCVSGKWTVSIKTFLILALSKTDNQACFSTGPHKRYYQSSPGDGFKFLPQFNPTNKTKNIMYQPQKDRFSSNQIYAPIHM
jgi:hypothetical protein